MRRRSRRTLLMAGVAAVVAVVAVVLVVTGEDERDQLEAALSYLPADSPVAVAVETDLGDDQWDSFARTLADPLAQRFGIPLRGFAGLPGLEGPLSVALLAQGVDYDDDVKPLLGGELVVGAIPRDGEPVDWIAALEVDDGDGAEHALRKLIGAEPVGRYRDARLYARFGGGAAAAGIAIDGDVILATDSGEDSAAHLRAAIDRAHGADHLDPARFEGAVEGMPEDALARAYGNPEGLSESIPELRRLAALRWLAALGSIGASASFEGNQVELELIARTDPEQLDAGDLPFAQGGGEPELVQREGWTSSGTLDQSVTTAFLLAAARRVFADSRFVRDVEEVERDLGIDFGQEVLRQFKGPTASVVAPDGSFAARSTVADPEAMRRLLPRLAPRLPELVRDLDSLGQEGLLALLFVAPDAPVAPAPSGAGEIENEGQLYVIRGPRAPAGLRPRVPLPERIVFGMVDDAFVVASERELALEIADAEGEPVEGLEGASVLYAPDLTGARGRIGRVLGFSVGAIESARASVENDLDSLRLRVRAVYD